MSMQNWEGTWLEPALVLLRRKTKEGWTEKYRNVARKLVLERRWVQQKLDNIGWSDESECQACHKEEDAEKHKLFHCPEWHEIGREIPEAFRKWEQKKAKTWRKSGSDKEVLSRILSVKVNGTKVISVWQGGSSSSTKETSWVRLQLTILFWLLLTSDEHVTGQWCTYVTTRWKQNLRSNIR